MNTPDAPGAPRAQASRPPGGVSTDARRRGRVLAVTSGKGGVGKTTVSANLAAALSETGQRVLVLDADLGLANLDVLLNLQPRLTLHEVILGRCPLAAAVVAAPLGFHAVLAGSGLIEYSRLTPELGQALHQIVADLAAAYEVVILDTGAGISDVVLHTISLADEVLVVTTPEPTALTDAYATVKVLATVQQRHSLHLLVNQTTRKGEGMSIRHQFEAVVQRYLQPALPQTLTLAMLGELPLDPAAREAVRRRSLVLQSAPGSELAQGLRAVARRLRERWSGQAAARADRL